MQLTNKEELAPLVDAASVLDLALINLSWEAKQQIESYLGIMRAPKAPDDKENPFQQKQFGDTPRLYNAYLAFSSGLRTALVLGAGYGGRNVKVFHTGKDGKPRMRGRPLAATWLMAMVRELQDAWIHQYSEHEVQEVPGRWKRIHGSITGSGPEGADRLPAFWSRR